MIVDPELSTIEKCNRFEKNLQQQQKQTQQKKGNVLNCIEDNGNESGSNRSQRQSPLAMELKNIGIDINVLPTTELDDNIGNKSDRTTESVLSFNIFKENRINSEYDENEDNFVEFVPK